MSDRLTSQWMTTDAPIGAADLSRPYWSVYANAVSRLCWALAVVLTLMVVGLGTGPSSATVSLQTRTLAASVPGPWCGDGICGLSERDNGSCIPDCTPQL
jgi:hypothetical protein